MNIPSPPSVFPFFRPVSPTSLTNSRGNASYAANHSGTFTLYSCNDGKEMYKKARCTCKVFVLLIKPIPFCCSRCRRRRRCFKLPNYIGAGRPFATSPLGRPLPGLKKARSARQTCEVDLQQVLSELKATIFQDILISFYVPGSRSSAFI